jgi:hypothetical protein
VWRPGWRDRPLDQGDGEDGDGQQNRDERIGVAGEIEVEHDVSLPFTVLDGKHHGKV